MSTDDSLYEQIEQLTKELHVQKKLATGAIIAVGERLDTDKAFRERTDLRSLVGHALELLQDTVGSVMQHHPRADIIAERYRNIMAQAEALGLKP